MSDESRSDRKRCGGTRLDGQPCQSAVLVSGDRCIAHAQTAEVIELRKQSRSAGGRASSRLARATKALDPTRAGVVETLQTAMDEVYAGTLAPARANSLASLARSLLAAVASAEESERLDQLGESLERLEQAIDERTSRALRVAP